MVQLRRIQKEYTHILDNLDTNKFVQSIDTINDDISHWRISFNGPIETPYEDGVFVLDIKFSKEYPFKFPNIKFITNMFHPNICPNGLICSFKTSWNPSLKVEDILYNLEQLLKEPNLEDYCLCRSEVVSLYEKNREEYQSVTKLFTSRYANGPKTYWTEKLHKYFPKNIRDNILLFLFFVKKWNNGHEILIPKEIELHIFSFISLGQ